MIDLQKAVYRRDNKGYPCVWYASVTGPKQITLFYGMLSKVISTEKVNVSRDPNKEIAARFKSKQQSGYKYLSDVTDQNILPVEEHLVLSYLQSHLPHDRTTDEGTTLPMYAKLYDNKDNKMFAKGDGYYIQPKLNGLRCKIGAKVNEGDMFRPICFVFMSKYGVTWDSLLNLETYLLSVIPRDLLSMMINDGYELDGELYIPGASVNDLNSYVKNTTTEGNKLLQFWCYDLAVTDINQKGRLAILDEHIQDYLLVFDKVEDHLNNKQRLVYVITYDCQSSTRALMFRDFFIKFKFEGLILRAKKSLYQFGKRNAAMWKFKATTDGIFIIKDIRPEGIARPDVPLLTLQNDINDNTFDVHLSGTFMYQKVVLNNKKDYIGKKVFVTYGERSGVTEVPFHVKEVVLLKENGDN